MSNQDQENRVRKDIEALSMALLTILEYRPPAHVVLSCFDVLGAAVSHMMRENVEGSKWALTVLRQGLDRLEAMQAEAEQGNGQARAAGE